MFEKTIIRVPPHPLLNTNGEGQIDIRLAAAAYPVLRLIVIVTQDDPENTGGSGAGQNAKTEPQAESSSTAPIAA
jgi:hypothetical protein